MADINLPASSFAGPALNLNPDMSDVEALLGSLGQAVNSTDQDTRIRLRAMINQEAQVYGPQGDDNNILSILYDTGGLLFPYTPQIAVSQQVDYHTVALTHSIGDIEAYNRTPSVTIQVTGKFTIQNQREGRYALAVLHFLRTASKMYFGQTDAASGKAGTPPPVLIFTGYGNYMFNNLPVVLKTHNYSFDEQSDTVVVQTAGGVARLPALFQVSMDLTVQQTPKAMRTVFNLDDFRTGKLMRDSTSTGWI